MEQEKVSALVEENMKTIFAYALSRVSHKEDAEDLAGDIILAILSSAHKIRDDNAFFGYIWAIAANTYKKYLYKKAVFTMRNWVKRPQTKRILSATFCGLSSFVRSAGSLPCFPGNIGNVLSPIILRDAPVQKPHPGSIFRSKW